MFGSDEKINKIKANTEALLILANSLIARISVLEKENKLMSNTMADLDAVLSTLTSTVAAVGADVQRLVVDFQALEAKLGAGVDTTNEVAAVNAAITALQGDMAAVDAADVPPAPPAA